MMRETIPAYPVEVLENRALIGTLLCCLENPDGITKMELYNKVCKNPGMPNKLDCLQNMGLITQEKIRGNGNFNATCIKLTTLGHDVAMCLSCANELLKGASL